MTDKQIQKIQKRIKSNRAIDDKRVTRKTGELPPDLQKLVKENIRIILDLD